jgi:hypothetical protein
MQHGEQEILSARIEAAGPLLVRDVLRQFGAVRLRAFGDSMRPAIQAGDLLDVRAATPDLVAPGDVVLVERRGRLFAHRVVWRGKDVLRTKGDTRWRADPAVTAADLLGVVTAVSRGGFEDAPPSQRRAGAAVRAWVRAWLRDRSGRRKMAPW